MAATSASTTCTRGKKVRRPLLAVSGPPEVAALELDGFVGDEALSTLFQVVIACRPSHSGGFDLDALASALLGKPMTLTVASSAAGDDTQRYFDGEVTNVRHLEGVDLGGPPQVLVELRPALARLEHNADNRLFSTKTTREIVSHVLDANGLAGQYQWYESPNSQPPVRPHTWQRGETDLEFIQRLLAEDGYVFWFAHNAGEHRLHIAGATQVLPILPGDPVRVGSTGRGTGGRRAAYLQRTIGQAPAVCIVRGRSADGKSAVHGEARMSAPGAAGVLHLVSAQAHTIVDCKREAEQRLADRHAARRRAEGRSNVPLLATGLVVPFTGRAIPAPCEYRMIAVHHEGVQKTGAYCNQFEAVAADAPLTGSVASTPADAPRFPFTEATVVGEPDADGCYALQFDNDRLGGCSAPVPLSHDAHTLFLPRPGERVHVAMIDGDPGRPAIQSVAGSADTLPFDPAENPHLGGVFTPAHKLAFNNDPQDRWVSIQVTGEIDDVVTGDRYVFTAKNLLDTVAGNSDTIIRKNGSSTVRGSYSSDVKKNHSLAAETIILEGKKRIVLMVGRNYIDISRRGVIINGQPKVHINPPSSGPLPAALRPQRPAKHKRRRAKTRGRK